MILTSLMEIIVLFDCQIVPQDTSIDEEEKPASTSLGHSLKADKIRGIYIYRNFVVSRRNIALKQKALKHNTGVKNCDFSDTNDVASITPLSICPKTPCPTWLLHIIHLGVRTDVRGDIAQCGLTTALKLTHNFLATYDTSIHLRLTTPLMNYTLYIHICGVENYTYIHVDCLCQTNQWFNTMVQRNCEGW